MTTLERWLLALPLAGGTVFGLFPFLAPATFTSVTGYVGDDPFVARLAGAAAFGYAVALFIGIREGRWEAVRSVVVATLVFNLISIVACLIEIVAGRAQPVVYLILLASLAITAITWYVLRRHGATPARARDVATYVIAFAALGGIAAAVFGILPELPRLTAPLLGYHGTDEFLFRQAGAATFGYAVMGLWELRSRRWEEMRIPTVMGLVFNGLSFVASLLELGNLTFGVAVIGPASLVFTIGFAVALMRGGR